MSLFRVDLCHSEGHDTNERLEEVIAELGGRADDPDAAGIGPGLNRFRLGAEELTVFQDAWGVDLAGPEPLVRRILSRMAGLD